MPKQSFMPSPFGVNEFGIKYKAFIAKSAFTITVSELEHLLISFPVTVNVVVPNGFAIGFSMSLLLSAAVGDHVT